MNRLLGGAILAIGSLLALGPPALADESGSTTATVDVVVRSMTVTPATVKFDHCNKGGAALAFPSDTCTTGPSDTRPITLTNGTAPAHIYVRATDFQGSEGGATWDLCVSAVTCSTGAGVDQAFLYEAGPLSETRLGNEDTCDINWYYDSTVNAFPDCSAIPNQSIQVGLMLFGPQSTTNPSPSFSTTITWTAYP